MTYFTVGSLLFILLLIFGKLSEQLRVSPNAYYSLSLWRQHRQNVKFEEQKVKLSGWLKPILDDDDGNDGAKVVRTALEFSFVLLKGVYRMHFQTCDTRATDDEGEAAGDEDREAVVCDSSSEVVSDAIHVDETASVVDEESWCLGPQVEDHGVEKGRPQQKANIFFQTRDSAKRHYSRIGLPNRSRLL